MGWHCITVWECQLKPKVRQRILETLACSLYNIYLENRRIKPYEQVGEICEAAEPDETYGNREMVNKLDIKGI